MPHHDSHDPEKKEPEPMTRRFLAACAAILAGILLVYVAIELLLKIWIWLALAAALLLGGYLAWRILRARRDRW